MEKGVVIKRLDINFITEDEMLKLNQKHLKHDNHTDILTFCYSDLPIIESEIFISFETLKLTMKQLKMRYLGSYRTAFSTILA